MGVEKVIFGLLVLLGLLPVYPLTAEVKLPRILTSNMVLQRDEPVKIWGWADAREPVSVTFHGQELRTKADRNGKWSVSLRPMAYGGPYEMRISGKGNALTLSNILIGDVWIGSGQSNMEFQLSRGQNAAQEIASANYPNIRLFTVGKESSFTVQEDLSGGPWLECNPRNVGNFSAVAYFFGKNLQEDLKIPIGLVVASVGGSNIETWSNLQELQQFEQYQHLDLQETIKLAEERKKKSQRYAEALQKERGMAEEWFKPAADVSGWKSLNLPATFEHSDIGDMDGVVWFSREVEVPAALTGKHAVLSLGKIDDVDQTWVNGQLVGSLQARNLDRVYDVDCGVLRAGKNRIVVKVTDHARSGGMAGGPEALFLNVDHHKIPLAGAWKYQATVIASDFGVVNFDFNSFPAQLYNSMLAPLFNFSIKGVIWYQGESNTHHAYFYRTLFAGMIRHWREKWGKDFPFVWVQLANYKEPVKQPAESDWADMREAQSATLHVPHTAQVVTVDIGEAGDIHPLNKQDVGKRLALAALKTAYGRDLVHSGPVYRSMQTEGHKVILSFSHTGSGLQAKDGYGYLYSFAIAGENQKFVWAKAYIEGDKVVVYSDAVKHPVAVRYAWADNPEDANLYNREGLPASPFRTDTWKTITQK